MKLMRLDKYLAEMGKGTRSQLKQDLKRGLVTVNGQVEKSADRKVDPAPLSKAEIAEIENGPVADAQKVGGLFGLEALKEAAAKQAAQQQAKKYTKIDE